MDADAYWRKLEEIGWLQFVPVAEHADLRRRLAKPSGVFGNPHRCFALTQYSFEWEYVLDEESYVNLVNELAEFWRGAFHPENIRYSVSESNTASGSFSHDGRDYSCAVTMDSEAVNQSVLDVVNEAIADSGGEVQYIDLPQIDQCAYLVLVPPDIYERAVAAGLIPPQDAFRRSNSRDEDPRGFFPYGQEW